MKRIQVPPLKAEQLAELEELYQKTDNHATERELRWYCSRLREVSEPKK
jgi:hypothetical protein